MKIYKLIVREQAPDPLGAMLSSYSAPYKEIRFEYYITKSMAEFNGEKFKEVAETLYGKINRISYYITEIEVHE